jgi:hypothetical protein
MATAPFRLSYLGKKIQRMTKHVPRSRRVLPTGWTARGSDPCAG